MAFTLSVLITLIRLGLAYVTFSDPVFSSGDPPLLSTLFSRSLDSFLLLPEPWSSTQLKII